jgi:hypothetical protein
MCASRIELGLHIVCYFSSLVLVGWCDSSPFMNEHTRKVWKILNPLLKTEVIENEMLIVALYSGLSNVTYI